MDGSHKRSELGGSRPSEPCLHWSCMYMHIIEFYQRTCVHKRTHTHTHTSHTIQSQTPRACISLDDIVHCSMHGILAKCDIRSIHVLLLGMDGSQNTHVYGGHAHACCCASHVACMTFCYIPHTHIHTHTYTFLLLVLLHVLYMLRA